MSSPSPSPSPSPSAAAVCSFIGNGPPPSTLTGRTLSTTSHRNRNLHRHVHRHRHGHGHQHDNNGSHSIPSCAPAPPSRATRSTIACTATATVPSPPDIVSEQGLVEAVEQARAGVAVIKVYARSCRSCKRIERPYARLAVKYGAEGVDCWQLCADADDARQELAQGLGIRGFPTFVFFQRGKRVEHIASSCVDTVEETLVDLL